MEADLDAVDLLDIGGGMSRYRHPAEGSHNETGEPLETQVYDANAAAVAPVSAPGEPGEAVAAGRPPEPEPAPLPEPAESAPEPGRRPEEAGVADGQAAITMVERIARAETAVR